MENRTGGIAQNTYWRSAAHSHSEDSIGTGNHAKREKSKKTKTKTRSRGREAGTGACEISPTLNAPKETKNKQRRYIVTADAISHGKKAEYKRSLKTKSIASASMGKRIRRRGNAGTASWSDRGIGQPVWQYAYQELNYTVYGKSEERKSVTSISAGLL